MRMEGLASKWVLIAVLAGAAASVQAGSMQARIANMTSGAGTMQEVVVDLEWPQGAAQGQLRLRAQRLALPVLGYQARDLDWKCPLVRADGGWTCAGAVQVRGSAPGRLSLALAPAVTRAELRLGDRGLVLENQAASPDRNRILLERVPVEWLKVFLAGLWSDGRWTSGAMTGRIDIASPANVPLAADLDLELSNIGLETPSGLVAAAGLGGRLQLAHRASGDDTRIDARFTARGGEFLVDSLYATLPVTPVELHVEARRRGLGPWELPQLAWSDPGVLTVEGRAVLDAVSLPDSLDITLAALDLAAAGPRYMSGFLAPAGFSELALAGRVDARLQMSRGRASALSVRMHDVTAVDRQGRFVLAGVAGDLAWNAGESPVASRLGWRSGALFGIGLGAADFPLASRNGELRLQQAVSFEVLGGRVLLDHLNWQAASADHGATFDFGIAAQKLDLASLSQRLGWPAFTGSIDGRIPSAHFRDNLLSLDGGLEMDLFNGRMRLDKLSMERPFGVSPTLSADVAIEDIDLEPMTKVFGFGSISGRLDGSIKHLRLLDWSPVAFDARLQTDQAWKGKRRISQRAVNDISSVGGSGLIAGVQAKLLGFFDDFGYEQIGLGCVLKDNVCGMDGIGSAGDGYIIVAGAGLPRIQVVGFRRKVDWPTLVARLKAATEGQTPVIQ